MLKKFLSVLLAISLGVFLLAPASFAKPPEKVLEKFKDMRQELHGQPDVGQEEDDSVADEVYGKDKGKHRGVLNALQHVKNPLARAVLQAILDGRSVSEAVYQYRTGQDSDIDPDDVEIVGNEVESLLSQDGAMNKDTKAHTYRYMAQIQIKAGKLSGAKKFMDLCVQNNPLDEDAFKELDNLFARNNDRLVKVYVNGRSPFFDVPPYIQDGRTLVPVRFIAEGLGANVSYNENTGTVAIEGLQASIKMKVNSRIVLVNGQQAELDVPAAIDNGRTMVPLRFIGEGFKCKVKFYGESNLISVTNPTI